jgi:hypothetical protein
MRGLGCPRLTGCMEFPRAIVFLNLAGNPGILQTNCLGSNLDLLTSNSKCATTHPGIWQNCACSLRRTAVSFIFIICIDCLVFLFKCGNEIIAQFSRKYACHFQSLFPAINHSNSRAVSGFPDFIASLLCFWWRYYSIECPSGLKCCGCRCILLLLCYSL